MRVRKRNLLFLSAFIPHIVHKHVYTYKFREIYLIIHIFLCVIVVRLLQARNAVGSSLLKNTVTAAQMIHRELVCSLGF